MSLRSAKWSAVAIMVGTLGALPLPGGAPGMGNALVSLQGSGKEYVLRDSATGAELKFGPDEAWIQVAGSAPLRLDALDPSRALSLVPVPAHAGAERAADRDAGQAVVAEFSDHRQMIAMRWSAELREHSRYVIVSLAVTNRGPAELPIEEIGLLGRRLANATRVGGANGGVIVSGSRFLGVEQPLAHNDAAEGRVRCALPIRTPLRPGETIEARAVLGFVTDGQLRRGFGDYIERERARPYRPFLHYNTWYSIGYFNPYTQEDLGGVIRAFNRNLGPRGVALDGYVMDDGWDNRHSLWDFGSGFPDGLGRVSALARQGGAGIGIWLSPWGGYGAPKQARLALGAASGFETRDGSFSLSGPRYFARFEARCAELLRSEHVAYFKFDGIGARGGPSHMDAAAGRDFEAMERLIGDLRSISPSVFVNETTGTWPSPFWLLKVDSIWRGGDDDAFAGVGTYRERWITYRDAQTYGNVVRTSPLYPLNSLMVHGILYAAKAQHLDSDPGDDFANEVWSYFGTGTQLQELYISPQLLSERNWDDLARAAKWSRQNAGVLRDTHWVGGDPGKLEVYGWAAWSPTKGTIVLRNPANAPAEFSMDLQVLFELPPGRRGGFSVECQYPNGRPPVSRLQSGTSTRIRLAPFEVLVLEASPEATPSGSGS